MRTFPVPTKSCAALKWVEHVEIRAKYFHVIEDIYGCLVGHPSVHLVRHTDVDKGIHPCISYNTVMSLEYVVFNIKVYIHMSLVSCTGLALVHV